jgi:hypothetical protein
MKSTSSIQTDSKTIADSTQGSSVTAAHYTMKDKDIVAAPGGPSNVPVTANFGLHTIEDIKYITDAVISFVPIVNDIKSSVTSVNPLILAARKKKEEMLKLNAKKNSAVQNEPKENLKFLASELNLDTTTTGFVKFYKMIDNKFIDQLIKDGFNPNSCTFPLATNLKISVRDYGKLTATYFGSFEMNDNICMAYTTEEKKQAFRNKFNSVLKLDKEKITKLVNKQYVIESRVRDCYGRQKPNISICVETNTNATFLSHISKAIFLPFQCLNPFVADQTKYNLDEFGLEAKENYSICHQIAIETAMDGNKTRDINLFFKAMAQEIFACRYLLKLFDVGHIRTPRKSIYEYIRHKCSGLSPSTIIIMAGLLAKAMHDEECNTGLEVANKTRLPWVAKEDECYCNPDAKITSNEASSAIKAGLFNIYRVFNGEAQTDLTALSYLPEPTKNAHAPLFMDKSVRKEIHNTACHVYVNDWDPVKVLTNLYKHKDPNLKELHLECEGLNKLEISSTNCRIS